MTDTAPEDEVLTHREAARLLKIGERTLYRLVADGIVPCTRIGGSTRYSKKVLLELVQTGGILAPTAAPDVEAG